MTDENKNKIIEYVKKNYYPSCTKVMTHLLYGIQISNEFIPINQTQISRDIGIPTSTVQRAFVDLMNSKILVRGRKNKMYEFKLNDFLVKKKNLG